MVSSSRKGARDDEALAAIDIGASKTVCAIAHPGSEFDSDAGPEILGVGLAGAQTASARTVDEIEAAVRAAVDAAERMAGQRIHTAHFVVGGQRLASRRLGVELDMGWGQVTADDLAECETLGAANGAPDGFSPVLTSPIGFTVDDEDAGLDPVGVAGVTLGAEILSVSMREGHAATLHTVAERCGLTVKGFAPGPLAAADAVLLDDEKDLGAVVLDMGAGATGFAVFQHGAAADCGAAAIGSDQITRDIAQLFSAPVKHAERVKTLYGAAFSGAGDEHRLVEIEQLGENIGPLRIARAELCAVISPRLEEIFELALARLEPSLGGRNAPRRIVLTGGGSLLVGAREAAEKVFGLKARLGRPVSLIGAPEAATAPQYSACVGALKIAAADERTGRARVSARLGAQKRAAGGGVFAGVGQWLRDNF